MSRAPWNNVLHPAVDAAERPLDTAPVAVGVRRMQKGGFRENTSLKSRLKTQGSVVQVLRAKKNIFLFALENRGTKKPRNRCGIGVFRCNIFF